MENKYYTVEQIAELLNMHPKTIQRYIREGKIKANKVGKEWRVTGHDLSLFTEGSSAVSKKARDISRSEQPNDDKIKISAVIDIDVDDMDEAIRIVNTLTAVLNSKPAEYGKTAMNAQFLESELKVKVMLWGNIRFVEIMLSSMAALTDLEWRRG